MTFLVNMAGVMWRHKEKQHSGLKVKCPPGPLKFRGSRNFWTKMNGTYNQALLIHFEEDGAQVWPVQFSTFVRESFKYFPHFRPNAKGRADSDCQTQDGVHCS